MNQSFHNSIDLYFLSGIIEECDLVNIRNAFNKVDLKVNELDRNGVPQANADDFSNIISLVINTPLLLLILKETWPNVLWDVIKFSSIHVWNKARNKIYTKVSSGGKTVEKTVTIGIVVNIDSVTNYNFRFEGLNSEEQLGIALDKTFKFLEETSKQSQKYKYYLGKYNVEKEEWEMRDLLQEIREKIETEKNK